METNNNLHRNPPLMQLSFLPVISLLAFFLDLSDLDQ